MPVTAVRDLFAPTVAVNVWAATLSDAVDMKKNTSYIALCGITAALVTAVMTAAYFPFLTYAIPAIAGALIMIPLTEAGKRYAAGTYIVTAFLVMLFAENEAKLMYVCLFGYYPVLKAVLEKIRFRAVEYILKFAVFNIAVTAVYLLFSRLFTDIEGIGDYGKYGIIVLYALGNSAFWLYDICLTRLCTMYMHRLHPKIKKIMKF